MNRIITYITVLAALMAMSCTRSEQDFNSSESSLLTLTLKTDQMITRSAITEDIEFAVTQFDWFIYPDATGTSEPVYHGHFNFGENGSTLTYVSGTVPSDYTADTDGTIHLGFDVENEFEDFTRSYNVYVLANYSGIDHEATDLKLTTLLANTVETNFDELSSSYKAITDFVMDSYSGDDDATYPQLVPFSAAKDEDGDRKANLAVELRRLAAKISFTITISEQLQDAKGSFWRPLTNSSNYTAYMVNAVSYATLAGEALDAEDMAPTLITGNSEITGGHQISYATNHVKNATDEHDPPLVWKVDQFYTYPVEFETDSNNAPYLKITLPWENVDEDENLIGSGATLYYYKAYLLDPETNKPLTSFDRNKHYIVALNVDTLGGTQEDYATLDTYYYVADWQSPADGTYTGYFAPRFLDVARDTYTIYGDNSITIAVTSSHNISATILSASQTTVTGSAKTVSYTQSDITTNGKLSFTLNHTLNTTLGTDKSNANMDVTPITWTVKVYHTDKNTVQKEVTIIQYPSIYVENPTSSGHVFVNAYSSNEAYNNNSYNLGFVATSTSRLKNFTIINVSSLASLADVYPNYKIGDPRVKLSDGYPIWAGNWNANDLGWSDSDKTTATTIPNYLITDFSRTSDKQNYIAPKIMMASGYGTNSGQGDWKTNAERCAAYQEDGYPAGRWRLPTRAEIMFFCQLDYLGYLGSTSIFTSGVSYWCAPGEYFKASGNGGSFTQSPTSTNCSVRCVYDLWYWGDEPYSEHATTWLGYQTD